MSTVNSLMLKLALRVDPRIKGTGAEFTASTIGVSEIEGDTFTAQRLLDIYNDARLSLALALIQNKHAIPEDIGGVVKTESITFGGGTTASKPTDYLSFIDMTRGVVLLDPTYYSVVASGEDPNYTESLTNRFVFEIGDSFVNIGGFMWDSPTLVYFGLSGWALTDVVLATTGTETIPQRYEGHLLELAVAISNGMGGVESNTLAKKLVGG